MACPGVPMVSGYAVILDDMRQPDDEAETNQYGVPVAPFDDPRVAAAPAS